MTDSCRFVVTLSRYSICSLKPAPVAPSVLEADTSEFLAMISSLTRFISTSSFSISTRTVLFTTGFPPFLSVCCLTGALFCGAAAGLVSGFPATTAGFSSGSSFTDVSILITSPTTEAISDTFSAALMISSSGWSEIMIRLNSRSNFSSSISCAEGLQTMISAFSSTAL